MASLYLLTGRYWAVCWREDGVKRQRQFGADREAARAFLETFPVAPRGPRVRSAEQVLAHIERTSVATDDGCRIWTGGTRSGYPRMTWKRRGSRRESGAHRVVYVAAVGEIPAGLTIDHLCCNPLCVNPLHLEPVTAAENTLRMHARKAAA